MTTKGNKAKPNQAITKKLRGMISDGDVAKVYNTWLALLDSDNEATRLSAIKWFADKFVVSAEKDEEIAVELMNITSPEDEANLRKALIEKLRSVD